MENKNVTQKKTLHPLTSSGPERDSEQTSQVEGQASIPDKKMGTDLATARKKGGKSCLKKYGIEHYQAMGKKGGNVTKDRHDTEYYKRIGALGGARRKKDANARRSLSSMPMIEEKGKI
jgi:general stress protein YciG